MCVYVYCEWVLLCRVELDLQGRRAKIFVDGLTGCVIDSAALVDLMIYSNLITALPDSK